MPLADGGVGGSRNLDGALREDGGLPSAGLDDLRTLVSETATTTASVSQLSEADQSAPDNTGGYGRFKEKWVVNLSGEVLSDAERSVLSKGLTFVPTPKYINNVEFITEVEKLVSNSSMTQDEANKVRFEVTKALQSFKPSDDNLTAEERRALRGLREREDLMILPSDKGKSVCVLTTEQYRAKVGDLIADQETYEELRNDPTSSYTRKVRGALKSIEEKG